VQRIDDAINRKDTAQTVVVKHGEKIDSAILARGVINKVLQNKITYKTFSAKVKVDYQDKDGGDGGTAFIKMQKDSIIWIQLTGPFNVEGFRLMVTKDSLILMNKLKKTVQYRSIEYLQELTQIPLDFTTLQDMIIGNPIYTSSDIVSYRVKESETLILMVGKLFKHLMTLDNNNYVVHSKLDDTDAIRNRTCDITYGDFVILNGHPFATTRKISVAENNKLDISMDFKQYKIDEPQTYPFNIPKNYKVK
jgi:hypothetical protein